MKKVIALEFTQEELEVLECAPLKHKLTKFAFCKYRTNVLNAIAK